MPDLLHLGGEGWMIGAYLICLTYVFVSLACHAVQSVIHFLQ